MYKRGAIIDRKLCVMDHDGEWIALVEAAASYEEERQYKIHK
ncbi:hypothetical protein [Paenibacillus polymyxa]|nr:hypothetical protein [Paenibacillus polymyxa]MDY8021197.1 hypothetical protein [Paenibacillus polymyxa]